MSSAPINTISWLAGTPCCRASRGKRSETFATAGPRSWVVISMSATGADITSKYSTRVAIATAPSARPRPAPSGSPNGRRSCCPFLTSTSCSRFPSRSAAWRFRIPDRFTPSFSGRFRNSAHHRRRSQTSRRLHRLPCRAAHLGSEPASSSAPALRRARRRFLPRRLPLDRLPEEVFLPSL